jgi:hypothetical protein
MEFAPDQIRVSDSRGLYRNEFPAQWGDLWGPFVAPFFIATFVATFLVALLPQVSHPLPVHGKFLT